MSVAVIPGDPRQPEATALLHESQALMRRLFSPEENHFLSLEALSGADIRFFTALQTDRMIGCAALALRGDYGEIKSMFVDETARGSGAADALMARLETAARDEGLEILRLETADALAAAIRLYERHGYTRRGPFGDYPENGTSVFMEKRLA